MLFNLAAVEEDYIILCESRFFNDLRIIRILQEKIGRRAVINANFFFITIVYNNKLSSIVENGSVNLQAAQNRSRLDALAFHLAGRWRPEKLTAAALYRKLLSRHSIFSLAVGFRGRDEESAYVPRLKLRRISFSQPSVSVLTLPPTSSSLWINIYFQHIHMHDHFFFLPSRFETHSFWIFPNCQS